MIFLDSARVEDATEAASLGYVAGITTNPTLIADEPGSAFDVLDALLAAFPRSIFFQPPSNDPPAAGEEALRAHQLGAGRVTVKLPARADFVELAARLTQQGVPCALTAVYAPSQAVAAAAAGCDWIIPYVDRAQRLMPEAPGVVAALASLCAPELRPPILAASIKSSQQGVQALCEGAAAITTSLPIIRGMCDHELSDQAIEEFALSVGQGPGVNE